MILRKIPVGRAVRSKGQNLGGVFNYLPDSNSIFRAGRMNSEIISRRMVSLPVAKARGATKGSKASTTKRDRGSTSRGVNARPNCRQQCCLTVEDFAGKLAALEVRGVAPIPTRCWEFSAASRKTSGPALPEARTLLGAGAGASRVRIPVKPVRAVPPEGDMPPRQPLDHAEVLAKLVAVLDKPRNSRSLEQEFEVGQGVASSETEYTEVLHGDGSGGRRAPATRWSCPGAAHPTHPSRTR